MSRFVCIFIFILSGCDLFDPYYDENPPNYHQSYSRGTSQPPQIIESAVSRADILEIARLLKSNQWSINRKFGLTEHTLLHAAVDRVLKTGDYDLLDFVLAQPGLDVDSRDKQFSTPLHRAASGSSTRLVEILLQHGASSHRINFLNYTPLDERIERVTPCSSDQILELLCSHSGSPYKYSSRYNCHTGWASSYGCKNSGSRGNNNPPPPPPPQILSHECKQLFQEAEPAFNKKWNPLTNKDGSSEILRSAWKKLYKKYHADSTKKQEANICNDQAREILGEQKSSKETNNPWEEK